MGSFSLSQLPLRNASPILIPFLSLFFFCSTQLCQEFLALFGGLSSSASIQLMFCVSHFTCRCVFLMCFWEKVSVTSYSSAILVPSESSISHWYLPTDRVYILSLCSALFICMLVETLTKIYSLVVH